MMKVWVVASLMAAVLTGCFGSARVWEQNERGGILTLEGAEDKAEEDAHKKASVHCGGPESYKVVSRSRVVVGQAETERVSADTVQNKDTSASGVAYAHSRSSNRYGSQKTSGTAAFDGSVRQNSVTSTDATRTRMVQDVTELRWEYRCIRKKRSR